MTTKATRDVIDLSTRPIDFSIGDGFRVIGDCGSDFSIDGIPIGLSTPCDARFKNLTVDDGFQLTGDLDMNGARVINAGNPINGSDYATKTYVDAATGSANIGNDFVPAGTMAPYPNPSAPSGWLLCNGETIGKPGSGANHQDDALETLFNVVKGMEPNTGLEDFASGDTVELPDMTGRIPVGIDVASSNVPDLNTLGATSGDGTVTLTEGQLAKHGHTGTTTGTSPATGSTSGPNDGRHSHFGYWETPLTTGASGDNKAVQDRAGTRTGGEHSHSFDLPSHDHTLNVTDAGNDEAHPNVQPSIALYWIIKSTPGVIDQDVLLADGSVQMNIGSNLTFNGGNVLGLPVTPTSSSAATSKIYVDTEISNSVSAFSAIADTTYLKLDGSNAVMTGPINMSGQRITNVPIPFTTTDVANSQHVLDEVQAGVSGTNTPGVTSGAIAHLGASSVPLVVGAFTPSGGGGYNVTNAALVANKAVMALLYVKVWDTVAAPSVQRSMVFQPAVFPTELWVPRMDGVNIPTGDILAQQILVPLNGAPNYDFDWDVDGVGLEGEIWLVGFVKSI